MIYKIFGSLLIFIGVIVSLATWSMIILRLPEILNVDSAYTLGFFTGQCIVIIFASFVAYFLLRFGIRMIK